MELCDYYLKYMNALCEGTLAAPEGIALSGETPEERAMSLQAALKNVSVPDFVRRCARAAGDALGYAALALADACGGEKQCIRRMNDLAGRIGMNNSHFENPNGLDGETHYSTARDMAKLAAYGAKNPTLMRICSTIAAQTGGRSMKNHNRLLRELVGCVGMKTGYTKAAGRTLVSCVEREGRMLVAVTLQDGNDWADHAALYAYGFGREIGAETAIAPGEKKYL